MKKRGSSSNDLKAQPKLKKSNQKLMREIEALTKRADEYAMAEIKKSIMQNPALMGQLQGAAKASSEEVD